MIRFAEVFADESISSTLWRQAIWSNFKEIIYQKVFCSFNLAIRRAASGQEFEKLLLFL